MVQSRPIRLIRRALTLSAVAGLSTAWLLYPAENQYSILTCTISYLGSPDPDRNPHGWRIYQLGMTALILLMGWLLVDRHQRFQGRRPLLGRVASLPLSFALLLLLAATWIPDSRSVQFLGEKATRVHTRLALVAIPFMGIGLFMDTVGRFVNGVRPATLWPAFLFASLVAFGFWKLTEWESLCRANPALHHWPGDGLHSTPLWEWITFIYLTGHFVWMANPSTTIQSETGSLSA